jgi:hypothetical protein
VLREQLGSISCAKNREPRYASAFSRCDRTRFFLLSLVPFLSSFFGKKEERNEHLNKRNIK